MEKGNRVRVRNNDFSGNPIIEGTAVLVSRDPHDTHDFGEMWNVRFEADGDGETYLRRVHPSDLIEG